MEKLYYIVGKYKSGDIGNIVWEFVMVTDIEAKAVINCSTSDYFYFPAELNVLYTGQLMKSPKYPKLA